MAILLNKQEFIEPLIALGVDINAVDSRHQTPIVVALKADHVDIAERLIDLKSSELALDIADDKGMTPLEIAREKNLSGIVERLEKLTKNKPYNFRSSKK